MLHLPYSTPLADGVAGWQPTPMGKVEMNEAELQTLSQSEPRQVRAWMDVLLEDGLEFTDEFEEKIRASDQDMAAGQPSRSLATPASRPLKKSLSSGKTCKKPNDFAGRIFTTRLFQRPARP